MANKRVVLAADERLAQALTEPLQRLGLDVETVTTAPALAEVLGARGADVLLVGARLADGPAMAALRTIGRTQRLPPTVLVLPSSQAASRAVALRAGFADVVLPPVRPRLVARRLLELAGAPIRLEPPVPLRLRAVVRAGDQTIETHLHGVSSDALSFESPSPLPPRTLVTVALESVESEGAPAELFARVRPSSAASLVRARWLALSAADREALESLVAEAKALALAGENGTLDESHEFEATTRHVLVPHYEEPEPADDDTHVAEVTTRHVPQPAPDTFAETPAEVTPPPVKPAPAPEPAPEPAAEPLPMPGPPPVEIRPARRRSRLGLVAVLVALGLLAAGGWVWVNGWPWESSEPARTLGP